MMIKFKMPKLDHVGEEGTVVTWRKEVGQRIDKGEILLELQTDKAVLEVESDTSGILKEILVEAEQTVPIGTPLAIIEGDV